MSKGFSLHIGLNQVDETHYSKIPQLKAAVNDALFWEQYAVSLGYNARKFHDAAATVHAIKSTLAEYAQVMTSGDILLLTYAGHGGQIANDKPSASDNEDYDQTWCLYDRQMLDDEIYECFQAFAEGTRILVVSDSCHSGTITKVAELNLSNVLADGMSQVASSRGMVSRQLPKATERNLLFRFGAALYKPLLEQYKNMRRGKGVKAAVKLLAACQDNQQTLDGRNNGIFTEAFIHILADPASRNANAEMLLEAVSKRYFFPNPNFFQYGSIIPAFDNGFPFEINLPDAGKVTGFREPDLTAVVNRVPSRPPVDWETIEVKKSAVLVMEVEGEIEDEVKGGNDVTILDKQTKGSRQVWTLELNTVPYEQAWSAAHALKNAVSAMGYDVNVEPVLSVNPAQRAQVTREGDKNNPNYIEEWPPSMQQGAVGIGWHLDEAHSQLAKAREAVRNHPDAHLKVRIAHLDTGYVEGHVALPANLNRAEERNFVPGESPDRAVDKMESGQDGHGLGTISLLAGNRVPLSATFNEFEGEIGGIPFADVIPMRISDSVVIWNSNNFCDAVDYAIQKKCEVISMSMSGKPSDRMAQAVNRAYEAGIVIVAAASNCWYKGPGAMLPKCVMYPAAFERAIAATGAIFTHEPYDVDFIQKGRFTITTKYMQGCWGPKSRMSRALAAYTPNLPWASTHHAFLRSGGGTSSATPQIAAAAALWIAYHRKEMEQKGYYQEGHQWKKVEAVRHALFTAAAKGDVFKDWKKYYGNGILRAYDALLVGVPAPDQLTKAPVAESSYTGLLEAAGSFFKNRPLFRSEGPKPEPEVLAMELIDLLQTDNQFFDLYSGLDMSDHEVMTTLLNDEDFRQKVGNSPYTSDYLKEAILS